jgi:hypothetical protein
MASSFGTVYVASRLLALTLAVVLIPSSSFFSLVRGFFDFCVVLTFVVW